MSDSQQKQAAGIRPIQIEAAPSPSIPFPTLRVILARLAVVAAIVIVAAGCKTTKGDGNLKAIAAKATNSANLSETNTAHVETITLREADVLKITFPAAANLNQTTPITREGNISLLLVGDIKAAGKTLPEIKEDILKAYATQTDSKEVTVELISSAFPVFVTGAVLQPGKFLSDHPITALEAIMERGGFDYTKANVKAVRVLRQEGNHLKSYTINLEDWMKGKKVDMFYMRPNDIIYVKEKFTWF